MSFIPGHVTEELSLESHLLLLRLNSVLKTTLLELDYIWEFIPFITNGRIETQIKRSCWVDFQGTHLESMIRKKFFQGPNADTQTLGRGAEM